VSCTEPKDLVHAYLDRELDLARSLEIEAHLRECAVCSEAYEEARRLRTVLSDGELYFSAPADLRSGIRKALRHSAKTDSRRRFFTSRAMAFGAPIALAATIFLTIIPLLKGRPTNDVLVDEIVSAHVRSLMADHLTDVASSDKHTVKPWFDGKLDFAPMVVDLADHGFPLIGGRLDYLGNRSVAALVYGRQKHFINVFIWPSARVDDRSPTLSRHGFNVIHWKTSEMTYWAVSDLNAGELEEFAGLIRTRVAPSPS
jgi:anti-sigma factor RsiW